MGMTCLTPLFTTLGATLECVSTLSSTTQNATLFLEIGHADWREGSSAVMLSLVMVHLMYRNSGVDDVGLDYFLVKNWLDGLVNVVMNMFALDYRSLTLRLCCVMHLPFVVELRCLAFQSLLGTVMITVVKLAVLDFAHLMLVLLWQDLSVMYRLDGMVKVILMHLLVDSCADLLMLVRLHCLVLHSGGDLFVDRSVMVTRLGDEVLNCCLCFLHVAQGRSSIDGFSKLL